MTTDELGGDRLDHVANVEEAFFRGHLRVVDRLQQQHRQERPGEERLDLELAQVDAAAGEPLDLVDGAFHAGAPAEGVVLADDLGNADLGYRGLYMPVLTNSTVDDPIFVHDAFIHELRGTVRYRFN